MSGEPLLRREFGPTLPEIVSGRFSVSKRLVAVIALIALVAVVFVVRALIDDGRAQLTVHGTPSFNVLYDPSKLHSVAPQPGELMRLQGRSPTVTTELTARRANLPPYKGDVIGGQLPLYAAQYAHRLAPKLPGFALGDEGKARVNQSPGYQIAYTSGPPAQRSFWREVFVMPDESKPAQTIVLRMRQTFSGRAGARAQALVKATRKAYRSFRFGTSRPLFG
jgi:hypothetical protein